MNTLFVLLMKYIIPDRQEWYWNYYLKSAHIQKLLDLMNVYKNMLQKGDNNG